MIKAMSSASHKYCLGDVQALLKSTEINALARNKDKVAVALQAEKLLEDMRAVARKHAVPDAMRTTLLGLADARVVHYLFNKPDDARGNLGSLSQIGHQFCQDVSSALGIDAESK